MDGNFERHASGMPSNASLDISALDWPKFLYKYDELLAG